MRRPFSRPTTSLLRSSIAAPATATSSGSISTSSSSSRSYNSSLSTGIAPSSATSCSHSSSSSAPLRFYTASTAGGAAEAEAEVMSPTTTTTESGTPHPSAANIRRWLQDHRQQQLQLQAQAEDDGESSPLSAKKEKGDKGDKGDKGGGDKSKDGGDKGSSSSGGGSGGGGGSSSSSTTTPPTQEATPGGGLTDAAAAHVRNMRPRQLMEELHKHVVGQSDAKKAVAIALRNRWRRHQVEPELREEISPKNILMVGPTGVGKTEIARRLAKLVDAPFVKVEATKFTEVGFHGRDVDTIIDDLYKASLSQTKQVLMKRHEEAAKQRAEDRILHALAGAPGSFREHLRTGALDDLEIMIDIQEKKDPPKSAATPEGVQISLDIPSMMGMGSNKKSRTIKKNMRIKDAMPVVLQEELDKMVETADVQKEALRACEEDGIVVIDEIDKIVTGSGGYKGHQASAEGVQQDLLPLVEGTTITTKSNVQVKTDKILFICSGAFHSVKVSDMLAELQGRLPIRVHLKPLSKEDFYRIVTEPKYNLLKQHTAMMATEGITLEVTDDAKWEIAKIAAHVNSTVQNIGARRLITITEKVMEEISFDGPDKKGETFTIDAAYVKKSVDSLVSKVDISKYLL